MDACVFVSVCRCRRALVSVPSPLHPGTTNLSVGDEGNATVQLVEYALNLRSGPDLPRTFFLANKLRERRRAALLTSRQWRIWQLSCKEPYPSCQYEICYTTTRTPVTRPLAVHTAT
jgi:hypothetical protein